MTENNNMQRKQTHFFELHHGLQYSGAIRRAGIDPLAASCTLLDLPTVLKPELCRCGGFSLQNATTAPHPAVPIGFPLLREILPSSQLLAQEAPQSLTTFPVLISLQVPCLPSITATNKHTFVWEASKTSEARVLFALCCLA